MLSILLIEHEQSPMLQHVCYCDLLMGTESFLNASESYMFIASAPNLGKHCSKGGVQCIARCAVSKKACKGCSSAKACTEQLSDVKNPIHLEEAVAGESWEHTGALQDSRTAGQKP